MSANFLLTFLTLALAAQSPAALPDGVEVNRDIVYATYGAKSPRLDLYRPKAKPAGLLPGLIAIRGGGWRAGDKNGFASIAAGLAERGFAAACIEYRVLPEFTIADAVADTKAAVRWMRAEGVRYGIQTETIGAIGGSAGGHLAALLGTSHKAAGLEGPGGNEGISSRVQAVVAMAPVVDFEAFSTRQPQALTIFAGKPELAKMLSPVTYLDKDSAPVLLLHSKADPTVPIAQSELMAERCRKAGGPVEFVTIEGAPHAFWNMPRWKADSIARSAVFFHLKLDRK